MVKEIPVINYNDIIYFICSITEIFNTAMHWEDTENFQRLRKQIISRAGQSILVKYISTQMTPNNYSKVTRKIMLKNEYTNFSKFT